MKKTVIFLLTLATAGILCMQCTRIETPRFSAQINTTAQAYSHVLLLNSARLEAPTTIEILAPEGCCWKVSGSQALTLNFDSALPDSIQIPFYSTSLGDSLVFELSYHFIQKGRQTNHQRFVFSNPSLERNLIQYSVTPLGKTKSQVQVQLTPSNAPLNLVFSDRFSSSCDVQLIETMDYPYVLTDEELAIHLEQVNNPISLLYEITYTTLDTFSPRLIWKLNDTFSTTQSITPIYQQPKVKEEFWLQIIALLQEQPTELVQQQFKLDVELRKYKQGKWFKYMLGPYQNIQDANNMKMKLMEKDIPSFIHRD